MKILGVNYNNITVYEALEQIDKFWNNDKKVNIFFLNADCLFKAQQDSEYRSILNAVDLLLSDGIGLSFATRILGSKMKDNCNGSDLSPLLLLKAAENGHKVFFLGGEDGVAEKAADNIKKKMPNIQIVGTYSGYFESNDKIINKINNSGADILFVAMGVPLQEKWIYKNRQILRPKLCLGVGALFDYLSGHVKRAPKIVQVFHLEWFWRILMEPKRLWKRYLVDDMVLFWLVLKQRLGKL